MSCGETLGVVLFNVLLVLCTLPPYLVAKVSVVLEIVRPLRRGSFRRKAVLLVTCICWRVLFWLCSCWIRVRIEGLDEFRRGFGASGRPMVVVANHMSFLDTLLLVPLTPLSKVMRMRMFVSSHLMKMPVLGTIVHAMGHIVVPFKPGNDLGSFELDKELMAVRQQELEDHVKQGGAAGWFPEGRMNLGEQPLEVDMFRAGGFTMATRLDVEVWCVAFVGNADCWPRSAGAGGRPARVRGRFSKLCDSSEAFLKDGLNAQTWEERPASMLLANATHDRIQADVDALAAALGLSRRPAAAAPAAGGPGAPLLAPAAPSRRP